MPVLAVATTLVALHRVQRSPLGARVPARRRSPQGWRLAPLVAGIVGTWYSTQMSNHPAYVESTLLRWLNLLSPLAILVGLWSPARWSASGSAAPWPGGAGARPR